MYRTSLIHVCVRKSIKSNNSTIHTRVDIAPESLKTATSNILPFEVQQDWTSRPLYEGLRVGSVHQRAVQNSIVQEVPQWRVEKTGRSRESGALKLFRAATTRVDRHEGSIVAHRSVDGCDIARGDTLHVRAYSFVCVARLRALYTPSPYSCASAPPC